MADLWVVLTIVAFFAICVAFVAGCDRIIGPDSDVDALDAETAPAFSANPDAPNPDAPNPDEVPAEVAP